MADNDEALETKPRFAWHANTKEECAKELGCDESLLTQGLTTAQAQERLTKYGPNKLTEKEKVTLLERIWNQIANVLVGILLFVALVSFIRALTATETDDIVSNWIQVGLILFVIT